MPAGRTSTKPGKDLFDYISLQLPVLGKLRAKIETTRFARTLAVLTNAGVDINTSLNLTTGVMGISQFRRAVSKEFRVKSSTGRS